MTASFPETKTGLRLGFAAAVALALFAGSPASADDKVLAKVNGVEIKESDGEDQAGVDQFGRKNPPFIVARRHGMAVYHRRPEEFQDPGQLDQLEKPDGRE